MSPVMTERTNFFVAHDFHLPRQARLILRAPTNDGNEDYIITLPVVRAPPATRCPVTIHTTQPSRAEPGTGSWAADETIR